MQRIKQVGAWFRREDYPAIKALSPDDENLPDTFDEWLEIADKQVKAQEALGGAVEKVIVVPAEFAEWCKASGLQPTGVTRAAFAVAKYSKQQAGNA